MGDSKSSFAEEKENQAVSSTLNVTNDINWQGEVVEKRGKKHQTRSSKFSFAALGSDCQSDSLSSPIC
jgi:hypothetical protein